MKDVSALIARILAEAIRAAEEAEIDAAYDRAYERNPVDHVDLERADAMARAAVRSTTTLRRKRGSTV